MRSSQGSAERYHYGLQGAFRLFDSSFIVRAEDPILARITEFLFENYRHFLKDTRILAAFRGYKINHITYQVLFKKLEKQDIFNGVVDYFP